MSAKRATESISIKTRKMFETRGKLQKSQGAQ